MARIPVRGGYSGRTYDVQISGDAPTATESARIQNWLRGQEEAFRQEYEAQFGPEEVDDGTAFGRGWDRGVTSAYGAFGSAIRGAGDAVDSGWIQGIGQGMEESARLEQIDEAGRMPAALDWDGARAQGLGGILTYAGELAGQSAPEMGATVGASIAGGLLTGNPAGAIAAGTAVATPFFAGRNIQRFEEENGPITDDADYAMRFLAAVPQAALNSIGERILVFGRLGRTLTPSAGQNLFTRAVRGAGRGVATEVPTEVTQQMIERYQAGLPIDDEEAIAEYREVAIGAGILGGIAGGVAGPFQTGRGQEDTGDQEAAPEERVLALPAPALGLPSPEGLSERRADPNLGTVSVPPGPGQSRDTQPGANVPSLSPGATPEERVLALPAPALGLPSPEGLSERRADPNLGTVSVPPGPGQSRDTQPGANLPSLSPGATATARSIGSDPQMLAAARAIQEQGNATVQVIQDALGVTYSVARGIMKKLENVGAVSKYTPNNPRRVTLPFEVAATLDTEGNLRDPETNGEAAAEPGVGDTPETGGSGNGPASTAGRRRQRAAEPNSGGTDSTTGTGPDPAGGVASPVGDAGMAELPEAAQPDTLTPEDTPEGARSVGEAAGTLYRPSTPTLGNTPEPTLEAPRRRTPIQTPIQTPLPDPNDPNAYPQWPDSTDDDAPDFGWPTETPEATPRQGEWTRDAMPGAPLTGPLRIPEGVRPAPRPAKERAAQTQAQVEQEYTEALGAVRDKVSAEATTEMLANAETYSGARDAGVEDPMTTGDLLSRVLPLLNSTENSRKGTTPSSGAYLYFSRNPDPLDALIQIAEDLGLDTEAWRRDAEDPYWNGTGQTPALRARDWIDENLTEAVGDMVRGRARDTINRNSQNNITSLNARGLGAKKNLLHEALSRGDITPAKFAEELKNLNARQTAMKRDARTANKAAVDRALVQASVRNDLHPAVQNALRKGDLRAALRGLGATASNPKVRRLAQKLADYTGDTTVRLDSPRNNPGSPLLRGTTPVDGLFTPGDNAILLNEDHLSEAVLLHEALHMATERTLENKSHPLTKQMTALFNDMRFLIGEDTELGLADVNEFVAYALSDVDFQNLLDRIRLRNEPVGMLKKFKRAIANFIRRLLGGTSRSYAVSTDPEAGRSVADEVDALVDALMHTAPDAGVSDPLISRAMNPQSARDALNDVSKRVVDLHPEAVERIQERWSEMAVPRRIRNFVADALFPIFNVAKYAEKYLPMSMKAWGVISGHHRRQRNLNRRVMTEVNRMSKLLTPKQAKLFNQFKERASLQEIDVRNPESYFTGYTLQYWAIDPKTKQFTEKKIVSFPDAEARNAAIKKLNEDGYEGVRSEAKKYRDFDPERLENYLYLRGIYDNELTPETREAYDIALSLYKNLHRETLNVFKARIEAMLPGQLRVQKSVYKDIFDRVLTESSLEAYQPLRREGNYWLEYEARDTVSENIELFKKTFASPAERTNYIKRLQALPEDAGVRLDTIREYQQAQQSFDPQRPSTFYVAEVAQEMERVAKERAVQAQVKAQQGGLSDADAIAVYKNTLKDEQARAAEMQARIVELAMKAMPERSFLRQYEKRQGVRGFEGDMTPIDENIGKDDVINHLLRKGASLSRQLANMEFSARASEVEQELVKHINDNANRWSNEDLEKAKDHANRLTQAMRNITAERNPTVQKMNATSYLMTLGFNPSSALMTVMAVPTIIAPYMAGKYNPMRTARALSQATKTLAGSGTTRMVEGIDKYGNTTMRQITVNRAEMSIENLEFGEYDSTRAYNAGDNARNNLARLRKMADEDGLLADSINYEMLDMENLTAGGIWQKFNQASAWMMHQSERLVRESTLLAFYDLELQDIASGKRARADGTKRADPRLTEADLDLAAKTAVEETQMTNGTIAAAGAPIAAIHGIMPMVYMFKRYPLSIYNMLGTLLNEAIPTRKRLAEMYGEDTKEFEEALEMRKVARLQFASTVGSVGLWAGAAGLPFYGAATALVDFFRDDDEPDADTLVRIALGELGFSGLGNYLFGVEMSGRIGLATMFYRDPLNSADNPPLWNLIEGVSGPAISISNTMLTRVPELFGQGEYYRGLETASPTFVRSLMRALRFSSLGDGGAYNTRGDLISDVGFGSVIAQGLGLAPSDYITQVQVNSALKTIDIAIAAERQQLLRQLNVAGRERNAIRYRRIMEEVREFNREHPQMAIERPTRQRSADTFEATTGRSRNGVVYNRANERMLDRLAQDIESPNTLWQAMGGR